jgi:hypothetical protein
MTIGEPNAHRFPGTRPEAHVDLTTLSTPDGRSPTADAEGLEGRPRPGNIEGRLSLAGRSDPFTRHADPEETWQ